MEKQHQIAVILFVVAVFFGAGNAFAQKDTTKLRQEVEVTKAYQPTISEVQKINDIPKIKSDQTEAPTFDYSIFSKPIFSTFEPTPVAAAKMVGDPRPEMANGILKLGFGNYLTPYGELFFNAQPDQKSNFGMHFSSLSSFGKIKLLNNDKVDARQSDNAAEIFGKRFFRNSTLTATLSYDRKAFMYYGYPGNKLTDADKVLVIPFWENKQYFSKGTAEVHLKSETLSKLDLNYDFGANYHYLVSRTGQKESQLFLLADFGKTFGNMFGILNASVTYNRTDSIRNRLSGVFGTKKQVFLTANPSVKWSSKEASFQLGVNSTLVVDNDVDVSLLFWPKMKAEWSPVPNILTLFAGADGHLQQNTYSAIAAENPYVDPYHDVLNTNFKVIVSGGLKGKLGSKTNYVAQATYSVVKDQHFYITESQNFSSPVTVSKKIDNTFSWVYDDVNILNLSGEVMHSVSDNFSLHLLGNYYSYDLKFQPQAWQMPDFDFTFSGIYKATDQLKFTTDIFVAGSRTALIAEPVFSSVPSHTIPMDPMIDLNAGAEYQFSNKLNFFFKLNNFGFQKYEQWLGYTNKGFNWMAGASYTF